MWSLSARVREIEELLTGDRQYLQFLSPATAACLAAAHHAGVRLTTRWPPDANSYAETIGLNAILNDSRPPRRPTPGRSYSPLVELLDHDRIDSCNGVISELIRQQLTAYPALAGQACQIVGELHYNVPAHANGAGFSIAQFYPSQQILEIAVADAGHGMLRNVQRHNADIATHEAAIDWCMQKGHTTAPSEEDWAQWMPGDAMQDPYGDAVAHRRDRNHHLGLGLWKLEQIARAAAGTFVVWSGDRRLMARPTQRVFEEASVWRGVVIILRLPIAEEAEFARQSALGELERLAGRLDI